MVEKSPCFECPERTEFCRKTCRKWIIWKTKDILRRKKVRKYQKEHSFCMTEGEVKRAIENLKWKSAKKNGRK